VLKKLSKEELDKRMLKNADVLGQLADQIQDKENTLRHLSDQREELVNNYIKGQRMALALWTNNLKRAKHRAFMRWAKNALTLKGEESDDALKKNVELIAALKDKINQLEKDNDDYSNENEELRQFSLDGYEIAKNVQ
jgi:CII-binding regulator of phage lambda lysogenization HflD